MLRVLGPLEIDGPRGSSSLGGPVPRRLLCALIARAGSVVPVDSLLDAAWGDEPPASAEASLRSHLTRLRDALSAAEIGAVEIERRDGGYRLSLDGAELDAARFVDLASEAEDRPAPDAVRRLREALTLWRGPTPYADLQDTAYPDAEAARLTELRGSAGERLVAALLDAGDPVGAAVEAEARLRDDPYREGLWEHLVVALYRQGRQADALDAYQRARRELDDGLGIEPGPRLRDVERRVLAQDPGLLAAPDARSTRRPCPYKGLARYDASDAELYVGRERLVEELLARLVDARFLVVVGPSGAGKSSLVRAGLVPALAAGGLPGSETWDVAVVVPGAQPIAALGAAFAEGHDVVVVDQTEEALLADDGAHVRAFGDLVLGAVDSGTRVVLALRADFFGRLAEHPALARRAGPATVLVAPPDDDELRRIVVVPAERVGLRAEPALVDLVVGEVRGRPGAMPVLSTALVRTWEHRDGDELTVASYRAGGGVGAALQRVGEEAWSALEDDDERAACRRLLVRLATDEDGQWVRRQVRRSELAPPEDPDAVSALNVLADRRLVVVRADLVEIAHEALLTGWPRLLAWLEEGRARADVLDHLALATSAWAAGGHEVGELYRGTRLQSALDTAATNPEDLSAAERAFLEASRAESERELDEQRSRADREATGRRRTRAVAVGLAAALVAAGLAGGLAVRQQRSADSAARAADAGRLGALAGVTGDYDTALLLAAQAVALDDSPATESDLFATLLRGPATVASYRAEGRILGLDLTRDQQTLVAATVNGTVGAWDRAKGGAATSLALGGAGLDVRTAADGSLVVLLAPPGEPVRMVTVDPGTAAVLATGPTVGTLPMAMSPDRQVVAAGTEGGDGIVLWRVGSSADSAVTVAVAGGLTSLTSCGAAYLCAGTEDDHLLRVRWDGRSLVSDVALKADLDAERGPPLSGSPDGSMAAVASLDGRVVLVDPATGASLRTLAAGGTAPMPLGFSPDGRHLAVRTDDSVLVWDLQGSALPTRLEGHGGPPIVAVWSDDSSTLFTAGLDGIALAWDLTGRSGFAHVLTTALRDDASTVWGAPGAVVVGQNGGSLTCVDTATGAVTQADPATNPHVGQDIATARSGRQGLVVVADYAGGTSVWDPRTCALQGTVVLPPPGGEFSADTWVSPDGTLAATVRSGGGPVIFDVATREVVRRLRPVVGWAGYAGGMAGWTADGKELLFTTSAQDRSPVRGRLLVVDATTGDVRLTVDLDGAIPYEAVADPLGRFVALAMDDGTLRLVSLADGSSLSPPLRANTGPVYNVSVSPDGRYVVTGGAPPRVVVWDTRTFRRVGVPLSPAKDAIDARARFLPDGRLVVASGHTVTLYDVDPERWMDRACAIAGRTLTRDEWADVLPTRDYDPACTP